jgi:hypothetical protein
MLNFRQFLVNASGFLNGTNDLGAYLKPNLPLPTATVPTISTAQPVEVFRVKRRGNSYEILASNNVTWYCPADHYIHLLNQKKAPEVGDKVNLEFYKDGTLKNFAIVTKKQAGLADG